MGKDGVLEVDILKMECIKRELEIEVRRSKYYTQRLSVKCAGQWNDAEFSGGDGSMIGATVRSEIRKFEQRGKWVI